MPRIAEALARFTRGRLRAQTVRRALTRSPVPEAAIACSTVAAIAGAIVIALPDDPGPAGGPPPVQREGGGEKAEDGKANRPPERDARPPRHELTVHAEELASNGHNERWRYYVAELDSLVFGRLPKGGGAPAIEVIPKNQANAASRDVIERMAGLASPRETETGTSATFFIQRAASHGDVDLDLIYHFDMDRLAFEYAWGSNSAARTFDIEDLPLAARNHFRALEQLYTDEPPQAPPTPPQDAAEGAPESGGSEIEPDAEPAPAPEDAVKPPPMGPPAPKGMG